jgi:hypothetical protein
LSIKISIGILYGGTYIIYVLFYKIRIL